MGQICDQPGKNGKDRLFSNGSTHQDGPGGRAVRTDQLKRQAVQGIDPFGNGAQIQPLYNDDARGKQGPMRWDALVVGRHRKIVDPDQSYAVPDQPIRPILRDADKARKEFLLPAFPDPGNCWFSGAGAPSRPGRRLFPALPRRSPSHPPGCGPRQAGPVRISSESDSTVRWSFRKWCGASTCVPVWTPHARRETLSCAPASIEETCSSTTAGSPGQTGISGEIGETDIVNFHRASTKKHEKHE